MLIKRNISSVEYRDCMARFAGAVHVVTTDGDAGRRGVTVSAVTSVSDAPPTLLFCLNKNRSENRYFEKNGCFALNTLCFDQIAIARAFAGEGHLEMDERFALGQWERIHDGAPMLVNSRMSVDCKVINVQDVATHYVIFGQVIEARLGREENPLIYVDRSYQSI